MSVGITSILMLGMATFFSGAFQNMLAQREKVSETQGQQVATNALKGKFLHLKDVIESTASHVVIQNDMKEGDLPFTYIGVNNNRLVFKDFFVFNGQHGIVESDGMPELKNPGGITKIFSDENEYFVASPLENSIYYCPNAALCQNLGIENYLDQPMDITTDGTDLFVTNAGKNQIIRITDPKPNGAKTVSTIPVTGLNYPTGIEYYEYGGSKYLFVSDTYNHVVKRVLIDGGSSQIVVGGGNDIACQNSAYHCKLEFPTGLVVETGNKALYIADAGTGRILKLSDPGNSPSNVVFPLTLSSPTQIDRIEFECAGCATIDAVSETGAGNNLHKVKYSITGGKITASLVASALGIDKKEIGGEEQFTDFFVDENNQIFQISPVKDTVSLEEASYIVSTIDSEDIGYRVGITPFKTTIPTSPWNVRVTNTFAEGSYDFPLNISNVTPGGFLTFEVKAYDLSSNVVNVPTDKKILRIGNGLLGTPEDTISVYKPNLTFPTGIGCSGLGCTLEIAGAPDGEPVFDETSFTNFDYTSDFEVQNVTFSKLNNNKLLELAFEAKTGQNTSGNVVWEGVQVNAKIP